MSVHSLSLSPTHVFSKQLTNSLTLLPDLGVEGDCHCGKTVQHRSRLHIQPPPKNLRQVHLLDLEILEEYSVKPGELGENITTKGLRLLELGRGTRLRFLPASMTSESGDRDENRRSQAREEGKDGKDYGSDPATDEEAMKAPYPVLVLTGLRNPCPQISHFRKGLQEQFITRDEERKIIARRAGVMSTVEAGGWIEVGMRIVVEETPAWERLECV